MINPPYLQEVSAVKYTYIECRKYSGSQFRGSFGFRLDCVMPGVQVTVGLGFFLHSIIKVWGLS